MIRVVFSFAARALFDFGLVLLSLAMLFFVVAFRTVRRFATPEPDKLDRVSAQLAQLVTIGLVASRRAASAASDEPELDDDGELYLAGITEAEAEQSVDFWRSVIV